MFTRLTGMETAYNHLTSVKLDMLSILSSSYMYEQNFIKMLDAYGKPVEAFSLADVLCRADERVIKLEGFEKYDKTFFAVCNGVAQTLNHLGPVTGHLFVSPARAASFPLHTDPDDVVIAMIKGSKVFRNDQEEITLSAGDFMLIPKNYPHQAINLTDNRMLSIGLESFTLEKL